MAGHYSGLSIAAANAYLNALPTLYLHLDSVEAGADDTGNTECVGTGYNCPEIPLGSAADGEILNDTIIEIGPAGAGGINAPVAWRATTSATPGAGTLYARGVVPLAQQVAIPEGSFLRIAVGQLAITFSRTET